MVYQVAFCNYTQPPRPTENEGENVESPLFSTGGFQHESSIGIIEWNFNPDTMNVQIPYGRGFANPPVSDQPYPFTGNGFTASRDGRLVPELVARGDIAPPEGAELFELRGTVKTLRAVFTHGQWTAVP